MKNFVVLTDTSSDLARETREKYDIEYIPMHICFEDRDIFASLDWEEISAPDFYNKMREGTRITTAQISALEYTEYFEKKLSAGMDILYLACAEPLSASIKTCRTLKDSLIAKYPERKIYIIDSCAGSMSLGLLCIKASLLRDEGKTIDECAEWIEKNKANFNMEATVEKLVYLKQAGRVSAASAFFGGLLNIKPIIISDVCGRNVAIEKVKGRKNSMARLTERFFERYIPSDLPIFILHANCLEEAEELKKTISERLENKDTEINIIYFGPLVGASAGPGTLCVCFYGQEVTFDAEKPNG